MYAVVQTQSGFSRPSEVIRKAEQSELVSNPKLMNRWCQCSVLTCAHRIRIFCGTFSCIEYDTSLPLWNNGGVRLYRPELGWKPSAREVYISIHCTSTTIDTT